MPPLLGVRGASRSSQREGRQLGLLCGHPPRQILAPVRTFVVHGSFAYCPPRLCQQRGDLVSSFGGERKWTGGPAQGPSTTSLDGNHRDVSLTSDSPRSSRSQIRDRARCARRSDHACRVSLSTARWRSWLHESIFTQPRLARDAALLMPCTICAPVVRQSDRNNRIQSDANRLNKRNPNRRAARPR